MLNDRIQRAMFLMLLIGLIFIGLYVSKDAECRKLLRYIEQLHSRPFVPTLTEQQEYLNATGNKRYYCGEDTTRIGAKFKLALENYSNDQYAAEMLKRMEGAVK